ncbi:MAG: hypothetical protein K5679_01175 [Lachnospiraceae bacterium]|nr:hypothetical protein [Lachnospiraceae bacterium]
MHKEDILTALNKIDFLKKSKDLSERYKSDTGNGVSITNEDVFSASEKCGFEAKYNKAGNTFSVTDKLANGYIFKFAFEIKYSSFDFAWFVYEGKEYIFGGPWLKHMRTLTGDPDYRCGRPAFKSAKEMEEILSEAFQMFKDFKEQVLNEAEKDTTK